MKASVRKGQGEVTDINISPLIDMVFILLIFFIVTTVFVEENGLDIETPEVVPPKDPVTTEPFTLRVSEDGAVFYEDEEIGVHGIPGCLRNARAMGVLESITIEVHAKSSVAVASRVLGLCSDGTVDKVTLKTTPSER